jgi:hypothetical protein
VTALFVAEFTLAGEFVLTEIIIASQEGQPGCTGWLFFVFTPTLSRKREEWLDYSHISGALRIIWYST